MWAVVVTFNRHHNKDAIFQRMFPWNVRAILRSLEGRHLFKSNIGSKHTRQSLSICFCHQSVLEDDNRHGETGPAGVELYLFHIYWIFSNWGGTFVQLFSYLWGEKKTYMSSSSSITDIYINMHRSKALQFSLNVRKLKPQCPSPVEKISLIFFGKLSSSRLVYLTYILAFCTVVVCLSVPSSTKCLIQFISRKCTAAELLD